MNTFWTNWFPNIVCGVGGCQISWWIGYKQGTVSRRTQANLLHLAARQAGHEVVLDKLGESTGTLNKNNKRPPPE